MFKSTLRFKDFDAPLVVSDGGIFFGGSSVFPVSHRLLRSTLLESDDQIAIVCCERFADEEEGLSVYRALSKAEFQNGIKNFDDHVLDVSIIKISRSRKEVVYQASSVAAAPIFLYSDPSRVEIDWDYNRLLSGKTFDVNWNAALAFIAGVFPYGLTTVLAGVYRSTASATITVTPTGVDTKLPEAVRFRGPHEAPLDADFEGDLFDAVKSLLDVRPLDVSRTVAELSGGMDSGLTSLAIASTLGPGVMSAGAQFGGEMGRAQRARRQLLIGHGCFDDMSIPAERFAPFSERSLCRNRYGIWPEDENYPELAEAMFGLWHASGIDTLISGFGGDELYTVYEGEEKPQLDVGAASSPFLSDHALRVQRNRTPYPRGWLQETTWRSAAARSQRLLRYGIWPVYPYHNVELARFISRLPFKYRTNRQLLRKALTRQLGNPVFEGDYVKETFYPVGLRGIEENKNYLAKLVSASPLSAHPDIHGEKIVAMLNADIPNLSKSDYEALFRTVRLYCFFQ